MSNPYKLKPGDLLYCVWYRNKDGHCASVKSVGRKWANLELGKYRVSLQTLEIDGGGYSSPGRCYLSIEHHEQEQKRRELWRQLREYLNTFNPPPSMTLERLEGILGALRGGAE